MVVIRCFGYVPRCSNQPPVLSHLNTRTTEASSVPEDLQEQMAIICEERDLAAAQVASIDQLQFQELLYVPFTCLTQGKIEIED